METEKIKERLLNVFSDIEGHKNDNALNLLDSVLKSLEKKEDTSSFPHAIEQKDSIKITKNTKGFNFEFRVVAKEGIDIFEQVDYTKKELDKRLVVWEKQK